MIALSAALAGSAEQSVPRAGQTGAAPAAVAAILPAGDAETKKARESWAAVAQRMPERTPLQNLDTLLFPPDQPLQSIALTAEKMGLISSFLSAKDLTYGSWAHDRYPRTNDIRLTGPYLEADPVLGPFLHQDGAAYMTHSRVRVYYSNDVVQWLKNDRKGDIPDGEMIIKEMYPANPGPTAVNPAADTITGYAAMIRQKAASKDGWLWFIWFPGPDATGAPYAQIGMSFCFSCHASADNTQMTFADHGNITGRKASSDTYFVNPNATTLWLSPGGAIRSREAVTSRDSSPHFRVAQAAGAAAKLAQAAPAGAAVSSMPLDLFFNHVVAQAGADGKNINPFLTSDSCLACHDASYLQNNRIPMMLYPVSNAATGGNAWLPTYYNLSPWSEWNASLMSQSARDPVFLAQLEYERQLRPAYKDYTSDYCFSCHGAMGQRQFHLDGQKGFFTPDIILATPFGPTPALAAKAKYGALARDGVSCTICHHIKPDGLGKEESFNAQFKVGPAHEVYGPYDGKASPGQPANPVKTAPMERGLGITPDVGPVIGAGKLCGSCHTVRPFIIPLGIGKHGPLYTGNAAEKEFKRSHEQTTYLEWANSQYSDEPVRTPTSQSCAGCHMPDYFGTPGNKLAFQIANVEDGTFPIVQNRDDPDKITLEARSPFRRHTLTGINLFTMQLFQWFGAVLGRVPSDPFTTAPPSVFNPVDRMTLAQSEAYALSQKTVSLAVAAPLEKDELLTVKVTVKNLAGHSFPSGVGFRRAWVNLAVKDLFGNVLWASGRSNSEGVLVDERNRPLKSEATERWQELQSNWTEITRQDQVQVYESRDVDDTGRLTTSFLGLFKTMKNNRILPAGWSPTGPYADITRPVELGGKPVSRPPLIGVDEITYRIPLSAIPLWATVEAQVFYQALPPYFLDVLGRTKGDGPKDLTKMIAELKSISNIEGSLSPIQGWRELLATASRTRGL